MIPLFEYTENNHYKWGYDGEWYNTPTQGSKFQIQLGYCKRPIKRFRDECIHAATLIGSRATKPIIVGLSGGIDYRSKHTVFGCYSENVR
jgi:hypothetical protein